MKSHLSSSSRHLIHLTAAATSCFASPPPLPSRASAHTAAAAGRLLKWKDPTDAHHLFDETSSWDVVTATAALGSLARHGRNRDAIRVFVSLLGFDLRPNQFTFGTIVHAATALRDIRVCRQLHALVAKMGFRRDVFVGSSLVDHYAKLGTIHEAEKAFSDVRSPNVVARTALISGYLKHGLYDDALKLFDEWPERNVVSWNAMIGGCCQAGLNEQSVEHFKGMCREGVKPNHSTFPCVFTSAANMAAIGIGRSVHASCIKHLGNADVYVGNSLISFYSKCGSPEEGTAVFDRLQERNVVSWNAVICGYAQNGRGRDVLRLYARMRVAGVKPNEVTLIGVLSGCNHAGMVDHGYACFLAARSEDPSILKPEHYACMVDLLSRFGRVDEAQRFMSEMPFDAGLGFWKALLGGCQVHPNKEWAEAVARRIQEMRPAEASTYVLLSNVYSAAGSWRRAAMIRREMKEKGVKRIPGCSWIEVRNRVHVFLNGDRTHDRTDEIYVILDICLEC